MTLAMLFEISFEILLLLLVMFLSVLTNTASLLILVKLLEGKLFVCKENFETFSFSILFCHESIIMLFNVQEYN